MRVATNENETFRISFDIIDHDLTIHSEEWKCHSCKSWIPSESIVWALPNGELSSINGDPYCVSCCPNEY